MSGYLDLFPVFEDLFQIIGSRSEFRQLAAQFFLDRRADLIGPFADDHDRLIDIIGSRIDLPNVPGYGCGRDVLFRIIHALLICYLPVRKTHWPLPWSVLPGLPSILLQFPALPRYICFRGIVPRMTGRPSWYRYNVLPSLRECCSWHRDNCFSGSGIRCLRGNRYPDTDGGNF